jgi:hypothetical protein
MGDDEPGAAVVVVVRGGVVLLVVVGGVLMVSPAGVTPSSLAVRGERALAGPGAGEFGVVVVEWETAAG